MIGLFVLHADCVLGAVLIDRIVAVVDSEVITQSELDRHLLDNNKNSEKGKPASKLSNEEGLKRIIEGHVITQAARRAGVEITARQVEQALQEIERRNQFSSRESFRQAVLAQSSSWEQYLSDLKMEMTTVALIQRELESDLWVTQKELRDYYQQHLESFYQAEEVTLMQIVFYLPDNAEDRTIEALRSIAEEARRGIQDGAPFDQMAVRYNAITKGEAPLLRLKKGEGIPEIEQIVFKMEVGEVSPVVQTALGFHLFKVVKKTAGEPQRFEEASPAISSLLLREKQERLTREWMGKLLRRTFIEIH